MRAVLAAEDLPVVLDAMADDAAVAVRASRRELRDRALEAVEGVCGAVGHLHRERLRVAVAADFASRHVASSSFHAARRFLAARFAGFFSMLFFKSSIRSMTSAPFSALRSFSGSVISSLWPAFTFSSMRFKRSSRKVSR